MRDAGHRLRFRDCPGRFGTVGTYGIRTEFRVYEHNQSRIRRLYAFQARDFPHTFNATFDTLFPFIIPYSRKIWRGIKFGALADRPTDRQIQNSPIFNARIYVYIRVYGIDFFTV